MHVRVDRIVRQQATMGGFAPEASPPLPSMVSDYDDDDDDASNDNDGDASSTDKISI